MPTHTETEKWALRLDSFLLEHAPGYYTQIYSSNTKIFIETLGKSSAIGALCAHTKVFRFFCTTSNKAHISKLEKPIQTFCLLHGFALKNPNKRDADDENYALRP